MSLAFLNRDLGDKKKKKRRVAAQGAQSMPDMVDRYIICVHSNSRTKLAMD